MHEHGCRILLSLALLAATGCSEDTGSDSSDEAPDESEAGDGEGSPEGGGDGGTVEPVWADCAEEASGCVPADFQVRESVRQLHITHAEPDAMLEVVDASGEVVSSGTVDYQGSLVFREVAPGEDYIVRVADSDPLQRSDGLQVYSVENSLPDPSFYAEQSLQPGFNYVEMRDGTLLAVFVSLPGPPEDGPYPTLVNYSGYDPGQPGYVLRDDPLLCGLKPVLCDAPNHPSGLIGGFMGYATVGVNMRGTGCSGGAYDYFEELQVLDGYDAIEIIARQPWVAHNKVGMAGLSYPGISQLFVAQSRPPSLAAITPLSVIADTASSVLQPGGIFNNGFALSWAERVLDGAEPFGKGWERARVEGGDTICEENQLLHSQKLDVIAKARAQKFYTDEVAGPLDPRKFVDDIEVPVFMSGSWQDEQTGPHFAHLMKQFSEVPAARFNVFNGIHPDGYAPQVLVEWKAFLDIYVAQQVPQIDSIVQMFAPELFSEQFGAPLALPEVPFSDAASLEEARQGWEAQPRVKVIFDNGVGDEAAPGAPQGSFSQEFSAWPPAATSATRWYFQPDGSLAAEEPTVEDSASRFSHDPEAGARGTLAPGGDVWDNQPDYAYRQLEQGKAVAFEGATLEEDTVMIGSGSVDLWFQSTAEDADIEVNLMEIRPDGQEVYVQSGWLRATHRALAPGASELYPMHTHLEGDSSPLPSGQWESIRVELMPFAHVFRAGSRIRLAVDTPGDSRAEWRFENLVYEDNPEHSVAHSSSHASSLVLPVVSGVDVPTDLPPCASLRGQPCREYQPFTNTPR